MVDVDDRVLPGVLPARLECHEHLLQLLLRGRKSVSEMVHNCGYLGGCGPGPNKDNLPS